MTTLSRVLITGGAGFVGSQLGAYLARQGYDVLLLDNMRYGHLDNLLEDGRPFARFAGRDIRDPSIEKLFEGIDVVFHLAGIAALPECEANPARTYDVHVSGTAAVLRWARQAGVRRVVFASTSAVYENSASDCQAESEHVAPDLVYSTTKYA
ncbi:MAG: NAD-dependent epimerase/dehydratase family protein, partial [Gemmatimonadaceae bacterium]